MNAKTVVIPSQLLAELLRAASAGYGAMNPEEERRVPADLLLALMPGICNHPEPQVREHFISVLMNLGKAEE